MDLLIIGDLMRRSISGSAYICQQKGQTVTATPIADNVEMNSPGLMGRTPLLITEVITTILQTENIAFVFLESLMEEMCGREHHVITN